MDVTESMEVSELPIDQFEFSAGLYNSSIAVYINLPKDFGIINDVSTACFYCCISRANIDRKMLPIKLVVNGALSKADLPWLIHPF